MQGLLQKIQTTSDTTKKKSFGTTFLKKVLPWILFKLSAKRVICDLGNILNEVNRGIVQKPDAVGTQN